MKPNEIIYIFYSLQRKVKGISSNRFVIKILKERIRRERYETKEANENGNFCYLDMEIIDKKEKQINTEIEEILENIITLKNVIFPIFNLPVDKRKAESE